MSENSMIGFRPAPHQTKLFEGVKKGKKSEKLREIVDVYLMMNYSAPEKIKQLEDKVDELNGVVERVNNKIEQLIEVIRSGATTGIYSVVETEKPVLKEVNSHEIVDAAMYFGLDNAESEAGIKESEKPGDKEIVEAASYFGSGFYD